MPLTVCPHCNRAYERFRTHFNSCDSKMREALLQLEEALTFKRRSYTKETLQRMEAMLVRGKLIIRKGEEFLAAYNRQKEQRRLQLEAEKMVAAARAVYEKRTSQPETVVILDDEETPSPSVEELQRQKTTSDLLLKFEHLRFELADQFFHKVSCKSVAEARNILISICQGMQSSPDPFYPWFLQYICHGTIGPFNAPVPLETILPLVQEQMKAISQQIYSYFTHLMPESERLRLSHIVSNGTFMGLLQ